MSTLKEQFTKEIYTNSNDTSECLTISFEKIHSVIDSLEKSADQHAIGFAIWFLTKRIENEFENLNDKELLEIYKKEQELDRGANNLKI